MTTVAIVIVSFNAREDLLRCLSSLAAAPPATPHEVVVVDNASTDGAPDAVAAAHPDVRLIRLEENAGFAGGNNAGIRATASELVLLLNPDTLVPPGAVDRLVAALRAHPGAAIAGPRIVDGAGVAELSFGPAPSPAADLRWKLLGRLHERGVGAARRAVERMTRGARRADWVTGACLLVRRSDLEAVGLLDERYFLYLEDVDLCAAVRARGRDVRFEPAAEVVHLRGRSSAGRPGAARRHWRRAQLAYYEKHAPRWAPWLRLYRRLSGARLPLE